MPQPIKLGLAAFMAVVFGPTSRAIAQNHPVVSMEPGTISITLSASVFLSAFFGVVGVLLKLANELAYRFNFHPWKRHYDNINIFVIVLFFSALIHAVVNLLSTLTSWR